MRHGAAGIGLVVWLFLVDCTFYLEMVGGDGCMMVCWVGAWMVLRSRYRGRDCAGLALEGWNCSGFLVMVPSRSIGQSNVVNGTV